MKKLFVKSVSYVRALPSRKTEISQRVREDLIKVKYALAQEKDETKDMLDTYRRFSMKKASKEEMKIANKQFGDLLKSMGLGIFAVLPFSPITIPIIVKLGHKFGISILPSSFQNWSEKTIKEKQPLE